MWRVSGGGGTQQDPLTAATLHHGGGTILGEQTYHASWLKVNMLGVGLTWFDSIGLDLEGSGIVAWKIRELTMFQRVDILFHLKGLYIDKVVLFPRYML